MLPLRIQKKTPPVNCWRILLCDVGDCPSLMIVAQIDSWAPKSITPIPFIPAAGKASITGCGEWCDSWVGGESGLKSQNG